MISGNAHVFFRLCFAPDGLIVFLTYTTFMKTRLYFNFHMVRIPFSNATFEFVDRNVTIRIGKLLYIALFLFKGFFERINFAFFINFHFGSYWKREN